MMDKKIQDAFNDQVNEETFSSYLYLSMSAWFDSVNLHGFAHWMRSQAREETGHAMKFFKHIIERGGRVELKAVAQPQAVWASPLEAFEAAYKHELHITSRIGTLMAMALEQKDYASQSFLKWFVDEQVEEEANTDGVVQKLRMAGEAAGALFIIDRELAARS
jgi:ferritin